MISRKILAYALSLPVIFLQTNLALASNKQPTILASNPAANSSTVCLSGRQLSCIDITSERVLWSHSLEGDGNDFYLDEQSLIVADNHQLLHFAPRTGEIRWQLEFDARVLPPLSDQTAVFVTTTRGVVVKINQHSGQIDWQRDFDGGWQYAAIGPGGTIAIVGADRYLRLIDKEDGRSRVLAFLAQEPVYRPVLQANGALAVSTFANQTLSFNLDLEVLSWQMATPAPVFYSWPVGDKLIEASMDGALTLREAISGKPLWADQPFSSSDFKLSANNSIIAAVSPSGRLVTYRVDTGVRRSAHSELVTPGSHPLAPILQDNQLLLVSSDGQINRVPLSHSTNLAEPSLTAHSIH